VTPKVEEGELSPIAGRARLEEVLRSPPPWGFVLRLVMFALGSAAFAVVLDGNAVECLFSAVTGSVVGVIFTLSAQTRWF
jgi:uncharacterized membrane protein YjjP (DUF1212 family)